jgi:hypothetical protein
VDLGLIQKVAGHWTFSQVGSDKREGQMLSRKKLIINRLFLTACILLPVGAFLYLESKPRYLGSGGRYDLTIHIESANEPITVECFATKTQDKADNICNLGDPIRLKDYSPFKDDGTVAISKPYDGQPLKVRIWSVHDTSMFLGRTVWYSQKEKFLVVYAEWADGKNSSKVIEIPDGRYSREVRVQLP